MFGNFGKSCFIHGAIFAALVTVFGALPLGSLLYYVVKKVVKWLITDLFIGFYISHYLMSHSCHMILSFNCLLLCINRLFHMSVFICIHLLIFYFFFCLSLSSYSPFSLILTTSRLFLFINYIVSSPLFTFDFSLSF